MRRERWLRARDGSFEAAEAAEMAAKQETGCGLLEHGCSIS